MVGVYLQRQDKSIWYQRLTDVRGLKECQQPASSRGAFTQRFGLYDMQGNLHEWIWEFLVIWISIITDPIDYDIRFPLYTLDLSREALSQCRNRAQSYNRPNASPSMKHPSISLDCSDTSVSSLVYILNIQADNISYQRLFTSRGLSMQPVV